METPITPIPIPSLEPRAITLEEYFEHTPDKLELLDGYLIDGPGDSDARRRLLALLLVNEGLVDTVRLVPRALWLAALDAHDG